MGAGPETAANLVMAALEAEEVTVRGAETGLAAQVGEVEERRFPDGDRQAGGAKGPDELDGGRFELRELRSDLLGRIQGALVLGAVVVANAIGLVADSGRCLVGAIFR